MCCRRETPGKPTPVPAAPATTAPFSVSPSAVRLPTAGCPSYARASAAHTVSVSLSQETAAFRLNFEYFYG